MIISFIRSFSCLRTTPSPILPLLSPEHTAQPPSSLPFSPLRPHPKEFLPFYLPSIFPPLLLLSLFFSILYDRVLYCLYGTIRMRNKLFFETSFWVLPIMTHSIWFCLPFISPDKKWKLMRWPKSNLLNLSLHCMFYSEWINRIELAPCKHRILLIRSLQWWLRPLRGLNLRFCIMKESINEKDQFPIHLIMIRHLCWEIVLLIMPMPIQTIRTSLLWMNSSLIISMTMLSIFDLPPFPFKNHFPLNFIIAILMLLFNKCNPILLRTRWFISRSCYLNPNRPMICPQWWMDHWSLLLWINLNLPPFPLLSLHPFLLLSISNQNQQRRSIKLHIPNHLLPCCFLQAIIRTKQPWLLPLVTPIISSSDPFPILPL